MLLFQGVTAIYSVRNQADESEKKGTTSFERDFENRRTEQILGNHEHFGTLHMFGGGVRVG